MKNNSITFLIIYLFLYSDVNSTIASAKLQKLQNWHNKMSDLQNNYSTHNEKGSINIDKHVKLIEEKNKHLEDMIAIHKNHIHMFDDPNTQIEMESKILDLEKNLLNLKDQLDSHRPHLELEKIHKDENKKKYQEQLENLKNIEDKYKYMEKLNLSQTISLIQKTKADMRTSGLLKQEEESAEDKANTAMGEASLCLNAFLSVVPPSFCYKKGGDAGVVPELCACGHFRFLALCYETCKPNYKFVLGVCWELCPSGYTDIGLFCYKSFSDIKTKGSYISPSYTNYDDKSICYKDYYKFGALCYRDCASIGMVNCGIGACSSTSEECISGIITIIVDFGVSLAQFVVLIVTFGSSSAATPGITALKTAAKAALNSVKKTALHTLKTVSRIAKNAALRKSFLKKAVKSFAVGFKDSMVDTTLTFGKQLVCGKIGEQVLESVGSSYEVDISEETFDPIGITGIVNTCGSSTETENEIIECASAVMEIVGAIDPTGLVGMAAALMKPVCEVEQ